MTRERRRKSKVEGTRLREERRTKRKRRKERERERSGGRERGGEGVQPWLARPDHLIGLAEQAALTSG